MCGRTACTLHPQEISKACEYKDKKGERKRPSWRDGDADKYQPSYNKCPQSNSPVLLSLKHFQKATTTAAVTDDTLVGFLRGYYPQPGLVTAARSVLVRFFTSNAKDADSSERVLAAMRWGLIPSWFTEADPSKMQYNTSNCRSDTITEKTLYKGPLFKGKRCVVLAEGFYEWRRQDGEKQPYYIYFPPTKPEQSPETEDSSNGRKLLTMAGLFDCWEPPNGGDPLYSYTVITVDASKAMNGIHDRMPAILDGDEAIQKWLDFGEVATKEALQLVHPIENITYHPVSTIVNNSRNNSPECIVPILLKAKKEPALSASGKKMLAWLQNKSPKKEDSETLKSPKLSKFAISPKKTSAGLMHQWLKKEEPSPKRFKK